MATLIDFTLDSSTVTNPDGSHLTKFVRSRLVTGPGEVPMGDYEKALDLNSHGHATVDLTGLHPHRHHFCVRVVFSADAAPTGREVLAECDLLPFRLVADRGTTAGTLTVSAEVRTSASGWAAATTRFGPTLAPGEWHTAALAYDLDTLAVFIDGQIVSVHAFPDGTLGAAAGHRLAVGNALDHTGHFHGRLAAVRWQDHIPAALESQLDDRRSSAEWFVTYKYELLRPQLDLGTARDALTYDAAVDAYVQDYDNGLMMYHDGAGVAFEMHGAIVATYRSLSERSPLGHLVSDERDTRKAGGRKSQFDQGAIYWSPATGAVPVIGQLYLDYERLGESAGIGFPTGLATAVPGGQQQAFEGAMMFHRAGAAAAHEVHGAILAHYLAIGGPARWGFPLTDETDVMSNGSSIGRSNDFDGCTVYWSSLTGAWEVHGAIRDRFHAMKGPAGVLGFPTCDETDVPGAPAPARCNTFQHGSLLWFGGDVVPAMPFRIYIGRLDTVESEGLFMGQNDLYLRVTVTDRGSTVFDQRFPSSGDYGGNNSLDFDYLVPALITPNRLDQLVTLRVDVWDSDDGAPFGGGDDHLGTWTRTLGPADGWGMADNSGLLNSGAFDDIQNITASIKPQVDASQLTEEQKWWGVANRSTPTISYGQYGDAFSDVDDQPEWWDIGDDLEELFYALVVEGLAGSGNCFGMSLEGINARKGRSLFGLPLDRFTSWDTCRNEFNIKHCYQVGAGPIWWFVGQFLSGNTHDPVDVFTATRASFAAGDNPVLCLAQNYDFSGAPHCVMPVAWNSAVSPWEITICDPNHPGELQTLYVDPGVNTFHYDNGDVYDGGAWTGGRLHYMPYHLLCSPVQTPIWEAILLILAGTVLILGDGAETVSIADGNGNDLDAFGQRARAMQARGASLDGFFFGVKGFQSEPGSVVGRPPVTRPPIVVGPPLPQRWPVGGELMLRPGRRMQDVTLGRRPLGSRFAHEPLRKLIDEKPLRGLASQLAADQKAMRVIGDRTLTSVAADSRLQLGRELQDALHRLVTAARSDDFVHEVRGRREGGQLAYAVKHGLGQVHVSSPLSRGQSTTVQVKDLGTSKATMRLSADHDRQVTLRSESRLGTAGDRVAITLSGIPASGGTDIQVSVKPGLGGVEVVSGGQPVNTSVTVEGRLNGRDVRHTYTVPLRDGIRIEPAPVLASGTLPVAEIGTLFGPASRKVQVAPDA